MRTDSDFILDVGQANELKLAFRRCGWTNADIKKATEGCFLKKVLAVLNGDAEIKYLEHLINCAAEPFIPEGWSVESHDTSIGLWKWGTKKIFLYSSKKQKKSDQLGHHLREELKHISVMNANILDFLLTNHELIPEEWKGKQILFWGTIYHDNFGEHLYVRFLYWTGSEWNWHYACLNSYFSNRYLAAVPA